MVAFLEQRPDGPGGREDQCHRHADGEHFAEHYAASAFQAEGREEREAPGELAVDDMVHDQHQGAAPEHFLECREFPPDGTPGLHGAFPACAHDDGFHKGYNKTGHNVII